MINTNGKRIARDDKFVEQLAEVRPAFYFQFDGFERRDLADRCAAKPTSSSSAARLDRLAAVGLRVTLVPAIERGVNEHEVGAIVDFAISTPGRSGDQLPAGVPRRPASAATTRCSG